MQGQGASDYTGRALDKDCAQPLPPPNKRGTAVDKVPAFTSGKGKAVNAAMDINAMCGDISYLQLSEITTEHPETKFLPLKDQSLDIISNVHKRQLAIQISQPIKIKPHFVNSKGGWKIIIMQCLQFAVRYWVHICIRSDAINSAHFTHFTLLFSEGNKVQQILLKMAVARRAGETLPLSASLFNYRVGKVCFFFSFQLLRAKIQPIIY